MLYYVVHTVSYFEVVYRNANAINGFRSHFLFFNPVLPPRGPAALRTFYNRQNLLVPVVSACDATTSRALREKLQYVRSSWHTK